MSAPSTVPAPPSRPYRGRLAPTPTGHLHLGHGRTFLLAGERAHAAGGTLLLRMEDLDGARCRPEFAADALEDLRWLGLAWTEGPDVGGPFAPYTQSQRLAWFAAVWSLLHATGRIYPCHHSRADVAAALTAPHADGQEPVFPPSLRPPAGTGREAREPGAVNWRFRVPDGRRLAFNDARQGAQGFVAGEDFGDFLVWRRDGFPSYELAVVADDHAMGITEVVRGADLLPSTARQLLLYEALGWEPPQWCHEPLVCDAQGRRLAKRDGARSLRALRASGLSPEAVRELALQRRVGGP